MCTISMKMDVTPNYKNAGNSGIPLFERHKSIERKKNQGYKYNRGNTSTIRGKQRNNRNTEVQQKQTTMQHTQKRTI